jgi:hypothetical protein
MTTPSKGILFSREQVSGWGSLMKKIGGWFAKKLIEIYDYYKEKEELAWKLREIMEIEYVKFRKHTNA